MIYELSCLVVPHVSSARRKSQLTIAPDVLTLDALAIKQKKFPDLMNKVLPGAFDSSLVYNTAL
jgi:hypothetical protein